MKQLTILSLKANTPKTQLTILVGYIEVQHFFQQTIGVPSGQIIEVQYLRNGHKGGGSCTIARVTRAHELFLTVQVIDFVHAGEVSFIGCSNAAFAMQSSSSPAVASVLA